MARLRQFLLLPPCFALGALLAGCVWGGQQFRSNSNDVSSAVPREDAGRSVMSLLWRLEIADVAGRSMPQEFASPALRLGATAADDVLFVGSHDEWFFALNASTGDVVWKVKLGSVSSKPLVYRGRIYVGTDDGSLICLDTLGQEKWRYATKAAILQPPVVSGESLLVANEGDQVYSLDLQSGKFRWLYKADSDEEFTLRGHSGLTVDGDLVYAGFADGSLVALRTGTGSVAWVTSLRGAHERFVDVDTTPVIAGELLVASSSAGGLFGVNKKSGRILWNREVTGGGGLLTSHDTIYFAAAEMGIYALDLSGNIRWRQGTRGGGEPGQPALDGAYLFFTLAEDGLFVVDRRNGEVAQYLDPAFGISSTIAIGRGRAYVLSNGAVLYALGLDTQKS